MTEPAHKGLLNALLAFQAEAPTLSKDGLNPHFKSKFTTLDTIVKVVNPLLTKHGLVWTTLPTRDQTGEPALRYRLTHAATGEALEDTMPLLLAKQDSQGQGSALSYCRRYSISAVLNLVSDVDDDGQSASQRPAPARTSNASRLSASDVSELKAAAQGLRMAQIKMALTSVGIPHAASGDLFGLVTKEKVPLLVEALGGVERDRAA